MKSSGMFASGAERVLVPLATIVDDGLRSSLERLCGDHTERSKDDEKIHGFKVLNDGATYSGQGIPRQP